MADSTHPKERVNLYQVAIDSILEKINNNDFTFEKPLCTEKQLMEDFSISRITAKRAITELEHKGILYRKRGVGSFVSRSIHSKSQGNSSEEMKIFAFVLPFDISRGGVFETVQRINILLGTANSYMCIYITDNINTKERHMLRQLLKQNISGLVFYPMANDLHLELLNMFVMNDKPVVVLDKSHDCQYISSVLSDNYSGGVMLTDYLLSLGHKNIAYMVRSSAAGLTSICDRFGGYLYSLRNAGIRPREDFFISNISSLYKNESRHDQSTPSVTETVKHLCDLGVTAIETENDEVAFSVMLACKELSIRVPEEISLCGFDNSDWAHMSDPGITTIKQDFREIGDNVAGVFLDTLEENHVQTRKIIVPVELVVQGSTGPVKE